jgi:hypothetical protein
MRAARRAVVFLVTSIVLFPVGARAQSGDAVGFDLAWNHVALSVPNIAESIAWYEKMLQTVLPEMMRWLWRDHGVSTDVNDMVERSFNRGPAR